MFLIKTEACILILVVIRTSYSLNEKQCSNAYTSCSQGQGVCKPECKKGEERLGSCHGAGCSCCKMIQPGDDLDNKILRNEISINYEDEFWLGKIYNWAVGDVAGGRDGRAVGDEAGGRGGRAYQKGIGGVDEQDREKIHNRAVGNEARGWDGREYLKGIGGVNEQVRESHLIGVGCHYEGNLYADGAEWIVDCMEHTCNGGHISSKLSSNCCLFEDRKYCDGDTWSRFCTVYSCNHGQVDSKDDENCCEDGGKKYLSGDSWTEGCFEIVCQMGVIQEKQLPSCCVVNEVLYESGQTWTEACDHFKCNNGMIERSDIITCCPGPDGVMKPSGETWLEGCFKKTCAEGTITEEIATDLCCVDNITAYKESETVLKNECEIHECKCTEECCNFVLTDDSQCEKETTESPATTEGLIGDEDLTPPDKCRYNNAWMEFGAIIIEGCFEITCQGGCACYEKLQHGCCYNNETEHKNEGETWEENCVVYTCADGNITEKESPRPECAPKEEGCMYGEKEYLDGETINYGCTIHQCKSGIFISYPDPTCCVIDGSAYSSGSKWEEECYTSICDMGMVKKIARGTCNNCQGVKCLFQLQQPQRCQSCCMVGEVVFQNGQTWTDNCNAHSCNQGTISITVMPNCG